MAEETRDGAYWYVVESEDEVVTEIFQEVVDDKRGIYSDPVVIGTRVVGKKPALPDNVIFSCWNFERSGTTYFLVRTSEPLPRKVKTVKNLTLDQALSILKLNRVPNCRIKGR